MGNRIFFYHYSTYQYCDGIQYLFSSSWFMLITKIVGIAKEKWFLWVPCFVRKQGKKMNARRNQFYVRSNRKKTYLLVIQLENDTKNCSIICILTIFRLESYLIFTLDKVILGETYLDYIESAIFKLFLFQTWSYYNSMVCGCVLCEWHTSVVWETNQVISSHAKNYTSFKVDIMKSRLHQTKLSSSIHKT